MHLPTKHANRPILIVDDNEAIQDDFRKILCERGTSPCLDQVECQLFGNNSDRSSMPAYEIETASQGQIGVEMARQAMANGKPYALAFVDMRMPPGWDGVKTIEHLWQASPDTQIVIYSAYSEYSWKDLVQRLGRTDRFLILKKPFDASEVHQLACSLTEKWNLSRRANIKMQELDCLVQARTRELASRCDDLTKEVQWRKKLQVYNVEAERRIQEHTAQLTAITKAMTAYLEENDFRKAGAIIVQAAMKLTGSEYGFSGVLIDGPALRILAHEGAVWINFVSETSEQPTKSHPVNGCLEFTNLNNLLGKVVLENKTVSSNDLESDFHPDGRMTAHPLRAFLGIPISWGQKVVGMIGVANRPDRYTETDIKKLEFLCSASGVLYDSYLRIQREAILQEQLRLSQRMESVGMLAGGIAHDFNNLLTIINGRCQLSISKMSIDNPLRKDFELVLNTGERAAALTRQLLAFSRRQVLKPKILNINNIVSDIEKMLRRLIGEDINLTIKLDQKLRHVEADAGQIEQVIMNLVINARDAMPQGGRLAIQTENVDLDDDYAKRHVSVRPGPFVRISVSDTGHGMDDATQHRIFEPFFTTKELGKGTGLGLSTVYGIVKQSNGNVWVYSEPDVGTTFKIYLPTIDKLISGERKATSGVAFIPVGMERVLIAEDEEGVRDLAEEILSDAGYTVVSARDGSEALEIAKKATFDLLITDVVMPRMGGRKLAERMLSICPKIKTLYVSGYTDDAIKNHGILGAESEFLEKPFSSKVLLFKVREVLDSE